jgi:hypothetical protein
VQGGSAVTAFVLIVGMVIPLIALGVVCWIFLRAKRAEDAAEKEGKWQNARSS